MLKKSEKKKNPKGKVSSVPACAIFDMMMPGCGPWMLYSEYHPNAKISDYELVKDERIEKYNALVSTTK